MSEIVKFTQVKEKMAHLQKLWGQKIKLYFHLIYLTKQPQ